MANSSVQTTLSAARESRALRIGAQGLGPGEAGLLRALVTLIANGRSDFPWVYAEHGMDAVVLRESAGSQRLVLRIDDAFGERLESPLSARQLEACLDRAAATRESAASSSFGESAWAATERYRLRRWPQAELLRGDRQHVRLATLLSRQSLTVDELAELSQLPAERCQAFTQLLQGHGLLHVAQPLAAPSRPVRRSEPEPAAPAAGRWNLVRSIRRKLGLSSDAS
ncbi:MAG: hypothetical protein V4864_21840 [Pseudomonadota bacterium]